MNRFDSLGAGRCSGECGMVGWPNWGMLACVDFAGIEPSMGLGGCSLGATGCNGAFAGDLSFTILNGYLDVPNTNGIGLFGF